MLKKVLKDERGLSLVELLAVVVIMAIIAGIGAVAITGVIQKNREDAAISSLQSVIAAANLYQASNGEDPAKAIGATNANITAKNLIEDGFITQIGGLNGNDKSENIKFDLDENSKLITTVDENTFIAGKKTNKPLTDRSEADIAKLTRTDFYK
ncbi:hypothetical protein BCR22_00650 [Enterococcus plantarum]|uniref:prepilin-type N-terminal cleavage/methylation domain-containing protein n=1 Tax=Enterococcus plantarum TaxID=1077675 RepID=UPI00084D655A|nr:prepilin-type N-terminal cleavage/methylation domain-containing protein [Enterococcus plantarum]OEG20952.1 hypothetical protein BCR22_00650 [Enterococcus plantarum]